MDFKSIKAESYKHSTFGECIRQQRIEMQMPIREVAQQIGVSPIYLSDLERGLRYAPIDNLNIIYKIFKVLNIPEDQQKYALDMIKYQHENRQIAHINFAQNNQPNYTDLIKHLLESEAAKRFITKAYELEIQNDEWDELTEQITKQHQKKLIKK